MWNVFWTNGMDFSELLDSLSCDLFNFVTDVILGRAVIDRSVTILYQCVQPLAYADDIDIIVHSKHNVSETFVAVRKLAQWV